MSNSGTPQNGPRSSGSAAAASAFSERSVMTAPSSGLSASVRRIAPYVRQTHVKDVAALLVARVRDRLG